MVRTTRPLKITLRLPKELTSQDELHELLLGVGLRRCEGVGLSGDHMSCSVFNPSLLFLRRQATGDGNRAVDN